VRLESAVDPQGRPLGPTDRITLSTPDGAILSTTMLANNPNPSEVVLKELARWGKWFNVLGVENPDVKNQLGVGFAVRRPEGAKGLRIPGVVDLTLKDGDEIEILVTNQNDANIYFAVLDFSTDGSIQVVYPLIGENSPLAPRTPWKKTTTVSAGPNGTKTRDYLKLIATPKFVDFHFLTQEGFQPKGVSDPLVRLLATKQFKERVVNPVPVETAGWTTETLVIDVLPK
jgi:hypothetical protein